MIFDIMQLEFFIRNAVIAGLLVSIICGIVGSLVVVNRIVFLAGGIAHASYGGIGITFFFELPYLPGTICFSLISSLIMAKFAIRLKHRSDTIIGVMWATGMAIGIILLDLTPGYNIDLMSYLFGSILAVPISELWIMFLLSLVICANIFVFYDSFLAISYDEEFARIQGLRVDALYYLIIALISVSIVMIVRAVGLIMVIAMLTIPPYIAEKFTQSLKSMMILSVVLNIIFVMIGLYISYQYNLTSGASIIIIASIAFSLASPIHTILSSRQKIN